MDTKTFQDINDITGFAQGEKWKNEQEIKDYFRLDVLREIFGDRDGVLDLPTQAELTEMADTVIRNHWWME